jgi:hypothetical protein
MVFPPALYELLGGLPLFHEAVSFGAHVDEHWVAELVFEQHGICHADEFPVEFWLPCRASPACGFVLLLALLLEMRYAPGFLIVLVGGGLLRVGGPPGLFRGFGFRRALVFGVAFLVREKAGFQSFRREVFDSPGHRKRARCAPQHIAPLALLPR